MSSRLPNGTILPSSLLKMNPQDHSSVISFNRTYKNTGLKAGFVIQSYDISDPGNITGLSTEYDVTTIEQFENKGSTSITYKNCLCFQGFGGIADYLEFNLRPLTKNNNKGAPTFTGQDGAIVLIQCLDNIGDKAIIVGSLIHPDRSTNIASTDPQLFGEYNGIAVQVNPDGSASLIFNGATDSKGDVIDSSQKSTTVQIQKDGSLLTLAASGTLTSSAADGSLQFLTSNGNLMYLNNTANEISVTQKDGNTIGMNSTGVTVSDATGKQIVVVDNSGVQLTSGGTIVEQSTGHTISSGSVNISGLGGVTAKDQLGGELNIKEGMVALGNSEAELLDLFNQLLQALSTLLISLSTSAITAGPFPVTPPLAVATAPALITITQIQLLLTLIKGTL